MGIGEVHVCNTLQRGLGRSRPGALWICDNSSKVESILDAEEVCKRDGMFQSRSNADGPVHMP